MTLPISALLLLTCSCAAAESEGTDDREVAVVVDAPDSVRAGYTKREVLIPMRDGTRLFTAIYEPRDASRRYPFLMIRTPYSVRPYGPDEYRSSLGPSAEFQESGYIFVYQDVRGRTMSEGDFVNMTPHVAEKRTPQDFDESSDAYDTIEWLLANVRNHNGRVGMWGISYPGFYAAASMIDAHPALRAVSPQAPIADWWYDDFHHHGAFFLPHCFNFISSFGRARPEPTSERAPRFDHGTPDGYQFFLDLGPLANANERYLRDEIAFWNETLAHPNYDEFWQRRNLLPHLERVAPAVMTVGGWFDAEDLYGPLQIYRSVEELNPEVFNVLVMGPWRHGGWARGDGNSLGDAFFGGEPSPWYQREIQLPFFEHHLKGAGDPDLPEATVFRTGANLWETFDQWPPAGLVEQSLWMHPRGRLAFEPPAAEDPAYDEYVSDPAVPVPFTTAISVGMTREYMTDDQRFSSRRPDVLAWQTDVLAEDVTVAGPILADLWVSTSGTDSDWIVKVIDVHPSDAEDHDGLRERMHMGGAQMMVRSEVMRGRFRNDPSAPEPFTPNQPTRVRVPLQDVLHTFHAGHRIMVQIQSTWFPLVDRNPQTFVPNIYMADEKDFAAATQRVHRSKAHATHLRVGVLPE